MCSGRCTGPFRDFFDFTFLVDSCVDQIDIAVVHLRIGIQQGEDPVCAGHGHDDEIQLLADLVDRHGEASVKGQEGSQGTEGQTVGEDRKQAADHGCEDVADVAQLSVDRHQHVGVFVGIVGGIKELIIQLDKFFDGLGFMVEHLDDLLAVHDLFDM